MSAQFWKAAGVVKNTHTVEKRGENAGGREPRISESVLQRDKNFLQLSPPCKNSIIHQCSTTLCNFSVAH